MINILIINNLLLFYNMEFDLDRERSEVKTSLETLKSEFDNYVKKIVKNIFINRCFPFAISFLPG